MSIWSHELAESSFNVGVGVGGLKRKILVSSPCIDEIVVDQFEFSAIVGAEPGIIAEGTIVQFSIILRFAVCHSENDLRAAIVLNKDTEQMVVGQTSVEVTQLPSLTLSSESSERNYSNLDNIIQLTAVLGSVYAPQNGTCATLSGARKRKLVAGVTEVAIT